MINDDRSPTSKEICKVNIPGVIYDALAADFDGDSKLDLFVLYKTNANQNGYNGGILWGDRTKLSKNQEENISKERIYIELFLDDLQPTGYLFQNIPTTLEYVQMISSMMDCIFLLRVLVPMEILLWNC